MARAWIGCSGWSYDHWVGVLYPEGLPKARWRDAYAEAFDCVELNASYYRWPGTKRFERWGEVLPDDFRMAVKASRWITHARRLRRPQRQAAASPALRRDSLGRRPGRSWPTPVDQGPDQSGPSPVVQRADVAAR